MTGLSMACGKIQYHEPSIDVGKMSTTSYFTESKEMYLLCTIWNPIGTHWMQGRHVGRPSHDCDHSRPTSTDDNKAAKGHIGPHRILHGVYNGICSDHDANG